MSYDDHGSPSSSLDFELDFDFDLEESKTSAYWMDDWTKPGLGIKEESPDNYIDLLNYMET